MSPGGLRTLAEAAYAAIVYETAWHEEDNTDYDDSDGFGAWLHPDTSWDGLSGWALRLHNHTCDVVALSLASAWAGRDDAGRVMPSGLYLVKLRAAGTTYAVKALLMK